MPLIDDIFYHCKGISQPFEPNVLSPLYHFEILTLQDEQSIFLWSLDEKMSLNRLPVLTVHCSSIPPFRSQFLVATWTSWGRLVPFERNTRFLDRHNEVVKPAEKILSNDQGRKMAIIITE